MIDVLMATYNGGKYVAQQLESLLAQSHTEWRLLIRDEGAVDGTREVCARYAAS